MNARLITAGALPLPVALSFLSASASAQTDNARAPTKTKAPLPLISGYLDIQHPVDKGLYFFGFDVEFIRLR